MYSKNSRIRKKLEKWNGMKRNRSELNGFKREWMHTNPEVLVLCCCGSYNESKIQSHRIFGDYMHLRDSKITFFGENVLKHLWLKVILFYHSKIMTERVYIARIFFLNELVFGFWGVSGVSNHVVPKFWNSDHVWPRKAPSSKLVVIPETPQIWNMTPQFEFRNPSDIGTLVKMKVYQSGENKHLPYCEILYKKLSAGRTYRKNKKKLTKVDPNRV